MSSTLVIVTSSMDAQGCKVRANYRGGMTYQLMRLAPCSGEIHQYDEVEAHVKPGYDYPVVIRVTKPSDYVTYAIDIEGRRDRAEIIQAVNDLWNDSSRIKDVETSRLYVFVSITRGRQDWIPDLERRFKGLNVYGSGSNAYRPHPSLQPHARPYIPNPLTKLLPWMR